MTLNVVFNPSSISIKSLRVIVIEQVNYTKALGEFGMHLNGHKSIEVFIIWNKIKILKGFKISTTNLVFCLRD
jgi:hypothetical protein